MTGPDAVRGYFRRQGRACVGLGSPFMGRLMQLASEGLSEDTAVGRRVLHWPGDPSPNGDNPALRLAGGLHALVLLGQDPGLASVYPPNDVPDEALWEQVARALVTHEAHLMAWLDNAPQTNEVRRAGALIPALHMLAARVPGPIHLWELGCSAGLNLGCDRFGLRAGACVFGDRADVALSPKWDGPVPPPTELHVGERRGVDLNPLDASMAQDRLRLLAYLWPDQTHRKTLTQAAIAGAQSLPLQIDRQDAVEWLAAHLPRRPDQGTTVLFHTIAWQYLSPEARQRGDALVAEAGRQATAAAPLARIALEADAGTPGGGLTLKLWPGERHWDLGRVDFHGRWVTWSGPTELPPLGGD